MKDKFSIIAICLALFGLVISGLALRHWSTNDDINTLLAPYLSKLTSLFFTTEPPQLGFTSKGSAITEELAIYTTMGFAIFCAVVSITLSFISLKKLENITFSIAALLLGNAVFTLYNLKIAFIALVLTGGYAIYLKSQLTKLSI